MARDGRGFVEGHDESIGKGDHAGMPKEVMMKDYPKSRMGRSGEVDDSMSDIDDVQGMNAEKRNRNVSNQK